MERKNRNEKVCGEEIFFLNFKWMRDESTLRELNSEKEGKG